MPSQPRASSSDSQPVSRLLPRHIDRELQRLQDKEKLARILIEAEDAPPGAAAGATSGGDHARMRGLPDHG